MNLTLHQPWTKDSFLRWLEYQEEPYEFDGISPVPLGGSTVRHGLIAMNIMCALHAMLKGRGLIVLQQSVGVETQGGAVRYPDTLVSAVKPPGDAYLIEGVVIAFEVVSPSSEQTDRFLKSKEYAAVPSFRHYAIVEQAFVGVMLHSREEAGLPWTTQGIADLDGCVALPAIGIDLPLRTIYDRVYNPESVS